MGADFAHAACRYESVDLNSYRVVSTLTSVDTLFQLGVSDLSTRAAILRQTELTRDEGGDMSPRPASAPPADLEPPAGKHKEMEPEDKLQEREEEGASPAPSAPLSDEPEEVRLRGAVMGV